MTRIGSQRKGRSWGAVVAIVGACAGTQGCGDNGSAAPDEGASVAALLEDGDPARVAPETTVVPPSSLPSRFCPSGDCARDALAVWRLDDCNGPSTELADPAFTSSISHPAFRAVSVACVPAVDGFGLELSGPDDVA